MDTKARLSNDEFLLKVGELFTKQQESGTVFLQQKRLTEFDPVEKEHNPSPGNFADISAQGKKYPLLFRASNGASDKSKKIKYTTVVESDKLEAFWNKYADVVKGGVAGLKKKDKKKTKGKKKKAPAKGVSK
ncbi:signal recognition particle, SRP9/SRP14 subunit [Lipomyces tetrasporus]|uniref:Signal recognition particle subunit SRP14 n=1 Tax=Lipomyces tetrasporus TaxID=54092 RepID=A0AAD7VTT9_9ASCO|nr:signal recognition particle, SRP9/SRP14 subunit [Lipomyces tetrasporus]KAJ8101336.1 signal recognition particle, SRP9/SRP14 subunit [Lipomyces tetrasporus]